MTISEIITPERYLKAHHSYVTEGISAEVMRKEAQARAFDYRSPEDTVIHFHSYDERQEVHCTQPGPTHEYYAAGMGKL
jgi:hypothetical protein